MPSTQPFSVSCKGGLNTNLNEFEILSNPGLATRLRNYEVDPDGGYRRINGYTAYGTTVSNGGVTEFQSNRPNLENRILGLQVYADGVIACVGTGIFFSNDGINWLQINRGEAGDSVHDTPVTYTELLAQATPGTDDYPVTPRTNQKQCTFTIFEGNTEYGEVIITDGVNLPFYFRMSGSGALNTRSFFITEIDTDHSNSSNNNHAPVRPTVVTSHENYLVVAGDPNNKNTIYVSAALAPRDFDGGTSIDLADRVIGIKSFRSDLIIFCRNSIHKLINIHDIEGENATGAIVPITTNVGCLAAGSIQEIGGDLLFLSPDGIRTIAGTARIGDVELSSVSRQVQAIVALLAQEVDQFTITSCVIRSKSQYRLFYSADTETTLDSRGLLGTLTGNGFEWSETIGIKAYAITSDFDRDGIERHYHGDDKGYVYNHDKGKYFHQLDEQGILQPSNINALYVTPNFDFGDLGTPKTLEYMRLSITPEASATVKMNVVLNSNDVNTPQPTVFEFPTTSKGGLFGIAKFDISLFGTGVSETMKAFLQGSGDTVSFQILTDNQDTPYTINGFYINYAPSTRR